MEILQNLDNLCHTINLIKFVGERYWKKALYITLSYMYFLI